MFGSGGLPVSYLVSFRRQFPSRDRQGAVILGFAPSSKFRLKKPAEDLRGKSGTRGEYR
jgi:hypothetical protein